MLNIAGSLARAKGPALLLGLIIILALAFFLRSNPHETKPSAPKKQESQAQSLEEQTPPPQKQPKPAVKEEEKKVSQAELKKAAAILDFFNQAETKLATNWFSLADQLAFFVQIYLGEWQLPKLPKITADRQQAKKDLIPSKGLWEEELVLVLQEEVDKMSKALLEMEKGYQDLTNYVLDPELMDNGVKGKRLARNILACHKRFTLAKNKYFELLEKDALPAEDLFLQDHPLKRQILATRSIFSLFRQISEILGEEQVERQKLSQLSEKLKEQLSNAMAPPFKDKPQKERVYRAFLKEVSLYSADLERGLQEGFFPEIRKLLNDDLVNCRQRYNEFVAFQNKN
ncbi:MAG: hypothetical protein IJS50_04335 [Desulfovibrio sp.]|nr:hypothetical protein [Desulfovibrio sp.]